MNRAEVEKRCYLACEAEVVARGFPARLAHDVLEMIEYSGDGNWTKAQRRKWFDLMFVEYDCRVWKQQKVFMEAFLACSEIVVKYAKLIS
ncbi:MAG: hypothetical protein AB4038_17060 [Prochloraceae cyanobacterium]